MLANLPYYISTRFLKQMLPLGRVVSTMHLMLQVRALHMDRDMTNCYVIAIYAHCHVHGAVDNHNTSNLAGCYVYSNAGRLDMEQLICQLHEAITFLYRMSLPSA